MRFCGAVRDDTPTAVMVRQILGAAAELEAAIGSPAIQCSPRAEDHAFILRSQ
jgi:hypothetical protein